MCERSRSAPCSCSLLERLWRDWVSATSAHWWECLWHTVGKSMSCIYEVPPALAGWMAVLCFQPPWHMLGDPSRSQELPTCLDHPAWRCSAWHDRLSTTAEEAIIQSAMTSGAEAEAVCDLKHHNRLKITPLNKYDLTTQQPENVPCSANLACSYKVI